MKGAIVGLLRLLLIGGFRLSFDLRPPLGQDLRKKYWFDPLHFLWVLHFHQRSFDPFHFYGCFFFIGGLV
jgi:hypothetical protein